MYRCLKGDIDLRFAALQTTNNCASFVSKNVISIDSILLNSMRNGKNVIFHRRKTGITSPPP